MQAVIKVDYAQWYESIAGIKPEMFGDDCLLDVISTSEQGAIVDNGIVSAFVPFEYLEIKGNENTQVSKARQTD